MAIERLLIVVDEKGARVVKRNIEDIGTAGRTASTGVDFLKRTLATLVTVATIKQLIDMADAFTNIQNRLRLVTESTEELTAVTRELFNVSQDTRTAFETNAEIFNRLAGATKDLNISNSELLQLTKSLNQAVIISGASATEASAGLIQLSQGLASGALRGDELRSVLEQLPAVADVIAKELGVTRGALRDLGAEGKITADVVLRAFANARGELEGKFAKTVPTVEQAFTQLKNQIILSVGEINAATGATNILADILAQATQIVADLTPHVIAFGRALVGTLDPQDEVNENVQVFASILIAAAGAVDVLATSLTQTLGFAFRATGRAVGGLAAALEAAFQGEFGRARDILGEAFADAGEDASKSFGQLRDELVSSSTDTIEKLHQVWEPGARQIRQLQESVSKPTGGGATRVAAPTIDPKTLQKQEEFIRGLQQQATELAIQAAEGEKASDTLLRYQTAIGAAAIGNQEFVSRALEAADAIIAQEQALEKAENAAADRELLKSMKEELELSKLLGTQLAIETAQRQLSKDATMAQKEEVAGLVIEMEKVKNAQADNEVLKGLEQELSLSKLTNRERAIEVELRRLSADATVEQKARVAELAGAVFDQTQKEKEGLSGLLTSFRGQAQNLLAGALADPLGDGFEELPQKFAQTLLQLSSQLLASEFFKLITGGGPGGMGGGGGGGIGGLIGGLFGGGGGGGFDLGSIFTSFLGGGLPGFANGGEFKVGGAGGPDSQLVGFMASPGESVSVKTPGQQEQAPQPVVVQAPAPQVVVVDDPSRVPAAMQSAAGESVVLDIVRNNRESIKKELGV